MKIGEKLLNGDPIPDLDGDFIQGGNYDDEDLFGENISDDELDVEQARAVCNDQRHEA